MIAGEAGFLGDIFEGSVSSIPVENVAVHARHEDVGVTVIVIVRRGNSHRVSVARYAGLLRNVSECQVAVILIQPVVELATGLSERWEGSAVGEVNVGTSVIIEVENSHASQHQLDLVKLAAGAVIELKVNARLTRNFVKADPRVA